jgi:chemotaxis-related protein WspB
MLLLTFQAGNDLYGLDVSRIIEVIPMVVCRSLPHADHAVAGIFNYRGIMAPVIDITELLVGLPSRPLFSTRTIMVDYRGRDGRNHALGLLAEQAVETVSCREEEFQPTGIAVKDAPFLGDLLVQNNGVMVQRVEIERLLPLSLKETLFPPNRED